MRPHRLLLLIGLLLSTALAQGCSQSHSTIEIRARASLTDPEGIAGIRLWLDSVEYAAEDFAGDLGGVMEISVEVPNSGDLQIVVELVQAGEVVAQGAFTMTMSDDFEWGMDLFRQAQDPLVGCFGCSDARSFPVAEGVQNEPGEALWFAWGGIPRGSDIVF